MEPRLFRYGLVDSTSERAFAALARGEALHEDAHVAEGQSAGRGRLGRRWVSAQGEGLYLSLVLLPGRPVSPVALTMAGGLGTLEGVRALGAGAARLKWPNDVLVGDAKLAGVLVESRGIDPEAPHAVVGVGLNVAQREFPRPLTDERAVTSLALLGIEDPGERALETLLACLRARLREACERPDVVASDYARASALVGREVLVRRGHAQLQGLLTRLALDGLVLRTREGEQSIALEHAQSVEELPPR